MACAIHGAILPLMLTSLPIFGVNIIENVSFEYLMIILAFAIGLNSLWHEYRKASPTDNTNFLFRLWNNFSTGETVLARVAVYIPTACNDVNSISSFS